MKNLYIFILQKNIESILKYGIKLSEYADKILKFSNFEKAGITAFLSPKDSDLYYDDNYSCIRVTIENINGYIYNKSCENLNIIDEFTCKLEDYEYGDYEEPIAIITSTILPENIYLYNKNIDVPLIIENSKEYYYQKSISNMLDSGKFSNYELYQILLILGEQKKIFSTNIDKNIKVYLDTISGKKYTKKSNF